MNMLYEEFKNAVAEKIKDYLPERFRQYTVDIHAVHKTNVTVDALMLVPPKCSKNCFPTFYVNYEYNNYLNGVSLDDILHGLADKYMDELKNMSVEVSSLTCDYYTVKNNVVMQLINTAANTDMLETIPSRQFMDLSIIYRWIISQNDGVFQGVIITNDIAEHLGITENELYQAAYSNTQRLLPATVMSVIDVYKEMCPELDFAEITDDNLMYIISNASGLYGASFIVNNEALQRTSEHLGGDLYILPLSINEVMVVRANADNSPEDLSELAQFVNFNQVDINERLSNEVYIYSQKKNELTMATNNNISITHSHLNIKRVK